MVFCFYISANITFSSLQVEQLINTEGGVLQIPETDVKLEIPPGALKSECSIQMRIIPPCCHNETAFSFATNSSTVVELLPSNLKLFIPVKLTLPHCLILKKGCKWKAKIYSSHHEEGKCKYEYHFQM